MISAWVWFTLLCFSFPFCFLLFAFCFLLFAFCFLLFAFDPSVSEALGGMEWKGTNGRYPEVELS